MDIDIMCPMRSAGHEKVWLPKGAEGYIEWSDGTDTVLCVFPGHDGWEKRDSLDNRGWERTC